MVKKKLIKHKDWYNDDIFNLSQTIWFPEQNKVADTFNNEYQYNINNSSFDFQFKQQKDTNYQPLNINKYEKPSDSFTKSLRIKLFFNQQQKQIIINQMNEAKRIYDVCVDLYNKTKNEDKWQFSDDERQLINPIFRYAYKKIYEYDDYLKYSAKKYDGKGLVSSQFCYDVMSDEIRVFCSNLKSNRTNLKEGNIKHFNLKYKDCTKFQSIFIKNNIITSNGIYPRKFGKQNINKKIIEKTIKNFIEREENKNYIKIKDRKTFNSSISYLDKYKSDSRLCYDKINDIFYLQMPLEFLPKNDHKHQSNVVAIDPGIKIPFCLFSEDHYGNIGDNMKTKLTSYYQCISKTQSILDLNVNKNGSRIKHKKYLKKRINKCYAKIKNIVKEFHNKTALFLCKNYETIMLPTFGTKSMVENKRTPLSKENKNVLNALSFYKFKQHLQHKATEYGCRLLIVSEHYTSMTCTKCGHQSATYVNREKCCEGCNYKIN